MIEIRLLKEKVKEKEDEITLNELNEEGFEILKNIAKELLFSGSDRSILNNEGKNARDIF